MTTVLDTSSCTLQRNVFWLRTGKTHAFNNLLWSRRSSRLLNSNKLPFPLNFLHQWRVHLTLRSSFP